MKQQNACFLFPRKKNSMRGIKAGWAFVDLFHTAMLHTDNDTYKSTGSRTYYINRLQPKLIIFYVKFNSNLIMA